MTKGFEDLYPEEKAMQNYIFAVWRRVAEGYGYCEVDGPVLEDTEIYRKSGEEIPQQMFTLEDKSGRKLALRPELTPTIARMIAGRSDLKKPIKWFSIGQFFRYEQPQAGRSRQFSQLNVDVIGTESMKADAEVIATAVRVMQELGFNEKDFFVRIGNRKLTEALILSLGIKKEALKAIARILDKICKYSKEEINKMLEKEGLTETQIKSMFKALETKNLNEIRIENDGLRELRELFSYLKDYGIEKYCRLDLGIMRGFDYYTGTVFELWDSKMQFRAIAGGGRYNELAKYPAVGYGMGDVVLALLLKEKKKLPRLTSDIVYIAPVNENSFKKAVKIAEKLRKICNVDIDLTSRSLMKQFEYANSIKASKVIIVGEKYKNKFTVRDMKTGKEKLLSESGIVKALTNEAKS